MKIRFIDYVCNLGGGDVYVKELVKALLETKKAVDIEFVSFGSAFENYKSYFIKHNMPVKMIDHPPINLVKANKKRILNIPGSARINQMFGIGVDWSIKVDPNLFTDDQLVIFPWAHKHSVPDNVNTKIIATIHDCILFDIPNLITAKEIEQEKIGMSTFFNNKHCKIVSISKSTTLAIKNNFQINPNNIHLIRNGTDHIYDEEPYFDENYFNNQNYLLYPANTFPHKNHEFLFEAFSKAKTKYNLVLTGDGTDLKKSYSKRVKKLNHILKKNDLYGTSRVIGLGYIPKENYLRVRRYCSGIVFPSKMEGFGFPLIEAMIAKKPLLVSDIPCARETIELVEGDATYFNLNDVSDLVAKIELLESKNNYFNALSKKISENLAHRNWSKVAHEYLNLMS